ncbi:MAG: Scr1 family TA system antitoxin-like transcriptional regulator [Actinomycetota bacterium]|nr:Scr1 family TA system antitoxin-like transcriptional regulator [Actinomycetota bacterium]
MGGHREQGSSARSDVHTRVSLGIIPASGERHCLTQGSFWIFDENRVEVESVSAGLDITQPREIAVHTKAFALLQKSAVHGQDARELIRRALGVLHA